jgi:AraC-like DNA-binding protein
MRIDLKNLIAPSKRIDSAIELLIHYNLTLIEIAYQLNYGSVEEFVNQFREWVGYSPEDFKQLILWDCEQESSVISRF